MGMNARDTGLWALRLLTPLLAVAQAWEHPIWALFAFAILIVGVTTVGRLYDRQSSEEEEERS